LEADAKWDDCEIEAREATARKDLLELCKKIVSELK